MDRQQKYDETIKYFNSDDLATNVWIDKYSYTNELTPDDMFKRISLEISRNDKEKCYKDGVSYDLAYDMIKDFKRFVFGGSPMAGIGNDLQLTSLANCYVIDGADDLFGGIFKTDQHQAEIMKRRGGVGHDLSKIRPIGAMANNMKLKDKNGIYSYMARYSNTTNEVSQGGRRGALMLTLHIKHPDADIFINRKTNKTDITGANISIKVDKEFLDCVKNNEIYVQTFPIDLKLTDLDKININIGYTSGKFELNKLYNFKDNKTKEYFKIVNAKELFDNIVENAKNFAEPGILYWDNCVNSSNTDVYGDKYKVLSTNPCGEQVLSANDSCRLGSMNLVSYVVNPYKSESYFDFNKFKEDTMIATRMMDSMIDLELDKIDKILDKIYKDTQYEQSLRMVEYNLWLNIRDVACDLRRIGLGITGLADAIAMLNMDYNSYDVLEFTEKVYKKLTLASYESSILMAKNRGSFKVFDLMKDIESKFVVKIMDELNTNKELYEIYEQYGRRNVCCNTIAPNGSVSLMTQTTSGVEPLFMPFYVRRKRVIGNENVDFVDVNGEKWSENYVIHRGIINYAQTNGLCIENKQDIQNAFELSKYYKNTAHDINPDIKMKVIASMQKWCDSAISSTTNLAKGTTNTEIYDLYMNAHEHGLKGITIYVDGSRDGILVSENDTTNNKQKEDTLYYKRPTELKCNVHESTSNGVKYLIFVGLKEDKPFEVFAYKKDNIVAINLKKQYKIRKTKSKKYQLVDSETKEVVIEDLAIISGEVETLVLLLVSGLMRHGMVLDFIVRTLHKSDGDITSFSKSVARVLSKYIVSNSDTKKHKCDSCGSTNTLKEDGCFKCLDCGYSKCN